MGIFFCEINFLNFKTLKMIFLMARFFTICNLHKLIKNFFKQMPAIQTHNYGAFKRKLIFHNDFWAAFLHLIFTPCSLPCHLEAVFKEIKLILNAGRANETRATVTLLLHAIYELQFFPFAEEWYQLKFTSNFY